MALGIAVRGVRRALVLQRSRFNWCKGARYLSARLPDGWEQVQRRNGEMVYYNAAQRRTVRELPGRTHTVNVRTSASSASGNNASENQDASMSTTQDKHVENVESASNAVAVPIDFEKAVAIEGHDSQVVHIELEPQQCLRAETGAMIYMTEGVDMETTTAGGIGQGLKRMMTGENFFVTRFTYQGATKGRVALSTSFPSKIVHLRLEDFIGNSIICQKGAFLCGSDTVTIEMEFAKKIGVGFFGGEGFVLQRLTGSGDALVRATGTLIERELQPGEVLRISSGCLVAFEPTVQYDITMMKGVKNVMFGGEGLFVTTLTGPGKVYLQSLPFDRVIGEIAGRMPHSARGAPFIPFFGGGGGGSSSDNGAGAEDAAVDAGADLNGDPNANAAGLDSDPTNESIYGGAPSEPAAPESTFDNWGRDGNDSNSNRNDDGWGDGSGGDDDDGEGGGGLFGFFSNLFTGDDD